MIYTENDTLSLLDHPNIVKMINCFNLDNMEQVFIMEYIEGGELQDFVKEQGRIAESDALIIFK